MSKIPAYIYVVMCIHPKKDREPSEIFIEYLETFPHIKYEGYGSHSDKTCYMIQITSDYRDILKKISKIIDMHRVFAYDVYKHILNNSNTVYLKHYWVDAFNDRNMPYRIEVPSEDISKLLAITKG